MSACPKKTGQNLSKSDTMANDSELGRLVLDYKKSADKKIADLSAKVDALADKDDAVSDILLLVKDLQTEVIKVGGCISNGIKVEEVRAEQRKQDRQSIQDVIRLELGNALAAHPPRAQVNFSEDTMKVLNEGSEHLKMIASRRPLFTERKAGLFLRISLFVLGLCVVILIANRVAYCSSAQWWAARSYQVAVGLGKPDPGNAYEWAMRQWAVDKKAVKKTVRLKEYEFNKQTKRQ